MIYRNLLLVILISSCNNEYDISYVETQLKDHLTTLNKSYKNVSFNVVKCENEFNYVECYGTGEVYYTENNWGIIKHMNIKKFSFSSYLKDNKLLDIEVTME
jgi:hypothetical protein